MQQDHTISADSLDHAFTSLATAGWRIQHRTPTTMQLVKPKHFKPTEAVLLAIVCVALVLFAGVAGILLALLLAVGDFIWYSARRDETMVMTLDAGGRVQRVGGPSILGQPQSRSHGPAVAPASSRPPPAPFKPAHFCTCGHLFEVHDAEQSYCTSAGLFHECNCPRFTSTRPPDEPLPVT